MYEIEFYETEDRTIFYIALVCIFHIAVDMIQFMRRSKKLLTKRKCCILYCTTTSLYTDCRSNLYAGSPSYLLILFSALSAFAVVG